MNDDPARVMYLTPIGGVAIGRSATEMKMPDDAPLPKPPLLRVPQSFQSVGDVLACAEKMELPNCLVLAEMADGGLVFLDSGLTMAETNWLLDRLKAMMLAPHQPMRTESF